MSEYKHCKTDFDDISRLTGAALTDSYGDRKALHQQMETETFNCEKQMMWDFLYQEVFETGKNLNFESFHISRGPLWTLTAVLNTTTGELFLFMKKQNVLISLQKPTHYLSQLTSVFNKDFDSLENSSVLLNVTQDDYEDSKNSVVEILGERYERVSSVFVIELDLKDKVGQLVTINSQQEIVDEELITIIENTEEAASIDNSQLKPKNNSFSQGIGLKLKKVAIEKETK